MEDTCTYPRYHKYQKAANELAKNGFRLSKVNPLDPGLIRFDGQGYVAYVIRDKVGYNIYTYQIQKK